MDIVKNFKRNKTAFLGSVLRRISFLFPNDKIYLKLLYLFELHQWPDLKDPQTFNEKLQWLKIYNRKPEYTIMVDKYEVKEYVSGIIGKEHIIPTLGVWEHFDDIDFNELPDKFVLKTTHGGGGTAVVICTGKNNFDFKAAKQKLEYSLHEDVFMKWREWPYKDVHRRIIAEKYIETVDKNGLVDYKIHCFNGVPRIILVCRNRFGRKPMDETFFSEKWEKLDLYRPTHDNPDIDKPVQLHNMLNLARKLSRNIPFVRVDFYAVDNIVYFGEMTFYPASGLSPFHPNRYDQIFGLWLDISSVSVSV